MAPERPPVGPAMTLNPYDASAMLAAVIEELIAVHGLDWANVQARYAAVKGKAPAP
jgi:hypothetical protein